MATVNTTWTAGQEDLRTNLLNGDGSINIVKSMVKALSGDLKLVCTPATVAPAPTDEAWTQVVEVSLTTNNGELCSWYNGNVTLAITDDATGTATISPVAGAQAMTDGKLTVTVSGDAGTGNWANTKKATLTASPTANNPGVVQGSLIANATSVITFTA